MMLLGSFPSTTLEDPRSPRLYIVCSLLDLQQHRKRSVCFTAWLNKEIDPYFSTGTIPGLGQLIYFVCVTDNRGTGRPNIYIPTPENQVNSQGIGSDWPFEAEWAQTGTPCCSEILSAAPIAYPRTWADSFSNDVFFFPMEIVKLYCYPK